MDTRKELRRRVSCRIDPDGLECGHNIPNDAAPDVDDPSDFQLRDGEIEIDDPVVKIYLLSDSGCPGCDEAKEFYAKEIAAGEIEVVYTDSDTGADIIYELAVYEVPKLVACLKSGRFALVEE